MRQPKANAHHCSFELIDHFWQKIQFLALWTIYISWTLATEGKDENYCRFKNHSVKLRHSLDTCFDTAREASPKMKV